MFEEIASFEMEIYKIMKIVIETIEKTFSRIIYAAVPRATAAVELPETGRVA
eukprot:SAG22_NODE_4992_length_1113_cov_7.702170_2_plen_52_part_00